MKNQSEPVRKRSWQEFREAGLLWWVNRLLHVFGWAIVVEIEQETGEVLNAYPARVVFRGFDEGSETEGFEKVTTYMRDNIDELFAEAHEEDAAKDERGEE